MLYYKNLVLFFLQKVLLFKFSASQEVEITIKKLNTRFVNENCSSIT